MERFVETVSCPQCGAVLTLRIVGRLHNCEHCGALLRLDVAEEGNAAVPQPRRTAGDNTEERRIMAGRIKAYLLDGFRQEYGIRLEADALALRRVEDAAQQAAYELSRGSGEVEVNLPFITADGTGPKHLNIMVGKKVAMP